MPFFDRWKYDPESPRIVDLCCGAGGAAKGLTKRWPNARIVGVDIEKQRNYPFSFCRGDALDFPLDWADIIWASPPCQAYSIASVQERQAGKVYPDLVAPVRARLVSTGKPYIIENVPQAPLFNPVTLCGEYFGLKVFRHRLFESNFPVQQPPHPTHTHRLGWDDEDFVTVVGHMGHRTPGDLRSWSKAMGIRWMTRDELTQAVPPAYSQYLAPFIPWPQEAL